MNRGLLLVISCLQVMIEGGWVMNLVNAEESTARLWLNGDYD